MECDGGEVEEEDEEVIEAEVLELVEEEGEEKAEPIVMVIDVGAVAVDRVDAERVRLQQQQQQVRERSPEPQVTVVGGFKCVRCSHVAPTVLDLQNHAISDHSGVNWYSCVVCGERIRSRSALTRHLKENHKDNTRLFECSMCTKSFTQKASLLRHIRKQHEEGHFSCRICRETFSTGAALAEHHLNSHAWEKAYACPYCDKCYTQAYLVEEHVKATHLGQRYQCIICDALFTARRNLRRHHATMHSEPRIFRCPDCTFTAASPSNWYSHRYRCHPGLPSVSLPKPTK